MKAKKDRKKPLVPSGFYCYLLDRAGNLTGTQTAGTNIDMAGRTVDHRLDALDIGLPRTIGASVGVGDLNTKGHTLVAKLALCHPLHLLAVIKSRLAHCKHWL